MESDPIEQWHKSLDTASTKGPVSKILWNKRMFVFKQYRELTKLTPQEMLAQDIDDIQASLKKFFELQKQKVSENSAVTYTAYLRGFFTHNRIAFPKGYKLPRGGMTQVSKIDQKTPVFDYDADGNFAGMNKLLPTFLSNLSFQNKVIALCLLSSGQDTRDLLALNVEFVLDVHGQVREDLRYFWEGHRKKDNIPFKTFLSQEASSFLRLYVEQERKDAKTDDPLFVVKEKRKKGEKKTTKRDEKRMHVRDVTSAFYYAMKKQMNITAKQNPFRPKRLRHIFRKACSLAKIDEGYINAFMGHSTTMSGHYLEKDMGSLISAYSAVEKFVTVFEKGGETSLDDIRKELSKDVRYLREQLEESKKRLEESNWKVDALMKVVEGLTGAPIVINRFPTEEEVEKLKQKHKSEQSHD